MAILLIAQDILNENVYSIHIILALRTISFKNNMTLNCVIKMNVLFLWGSQQILIIWICFFLCYLFFMLKTTVTTLGRWPDDKEWNERKLYFIQVFYNYLPNKFKDINNLREKILAWTRIQIRVSSSTCWRYNH